MNKKGFTLIELIVTVAVLAILASVFVMSNLNAMEKQRKEADVVAMEQIDGYLKEILINEDIFDEIKNNQDAILEQSADSNIKNTLILNFINPVFVFQKMNQRQVLLGSQRKNLWNVLCVLWLNFFFD